jgi:GH25 family lysozyme M1 (1,4-beta-N-acetylmuramidase)
MTNLPFGTDLSKWQGVNNFAKMKANTDFVFVKATESWGYWL